MMVGIAFAALAIAWMLALTVAVVFQLVALTRCEGPACNAHGPHRRVFPTVDGSLISGWLARPDIRPPLAQIVVSELCASTPGTLSRDLPCSAELPA